MKKSPIKVCVLKGFDGFNAEVIEIITRKTVRGGKHGRDHYVSYKGKRVKVFSLSADGYDVPYSACISI